MRAARRRPTPKQQRFIRSYVNNGGNATQAALEAYKTDYATARAIGSETLTKPNIRREIDKLMGGVQLTTKDAIRTVKEALGASTDKGPDWPARLKAADMTLKLADAYPKDKQNQAPSHLHQHLHLELQEELADEPIEVLCFIREQGRFPNEQERNGLLTDTPGLTPVVADTIES